MRLARRPWPLPEARDVDGEAAAVILGLLTAVFWGTADFLIKLLGDRLSLKGAIFWTQAIAALIVLAAVLAAGRLPFAALDGGVAPLLALEAATNALGLALLYAAFNSGRVAVVAPLVGSYAIVATAIGLATGTETATVPLLLTLGLISVGGVLVMVEGGGGGGVRPRAGALAALGSALASGCSIWLAAVHVLPRVPVPDVLLANFGLLALATLFWPSRGARLVPAGRGSWPLVIGVAIGCVAGYGCYNLGLRQGGIAVVSVVATLSSAVTVLLAGVVLGERVRGTQRAGLAMVVLGLPLLAAVRELGAAP